MNKLIAVDMDGTLLNDNGEIPQTTSSAISRAVERGTVFVVATGRPIQGVDRYGLLSKLNSPVITYNGAMVVEATTRKTLFNKTLLPSDAINIYDLGSRAGVTICVWVGNKFYVNAINASVDEYKKLSGVEPMIIDDFSALAQSGINKILWYDTPNVISNEQRKLRSEKFSNVTYCTSKPYFLEFMRGDVSKGEALQFIAERYGIVREDVIAVGDGDNDLPMIEYAGLGVAMANALDSVKTLADYVTERTNNDGGVAEVIEKFILNNE